MVLFMSPKNMLINSFVDTAKPVKNISPVRIVVSNENDKLRDVVSLMLVDKYRKIPIVDKEVNLKGMVTSVDILDLLGAGEKHEIFRKNNRDINIEIGKFATTQIKAIRPETSISKSINAFKKGEWGLYPLVKSGKLVSVVSEWDFVKLVNKPLGIKVYEAMIERPMIVKQKYSVYDVAKMMCRGGYRRLPVVNDDILVGIVTPSDILLHIRRHGIEKELYKDKTQISKIMNKEVVVINDDVDLFSAIKAMKSKRVGGLPVVVDDHIVGIITKRDILEVIS